MLTQIWKLTNIIDYYKAEYTPEFENYNFQRQDDGGFITSLSKCIYAKAFLTRIWIIIFTLELTH